MCKMSISCTKSFYTSDINLLLFLVEDAKPTDPEYKTLTDLDVGDIVKGFVKSVSPAGVFVR